MVFVAVGGGCCSRWYVLKGLGVSASGHKRCLIRRWTNECQGDRERGEGHGVEGGRKRGKREEHASNGASLARSLARSLSNTHEYVYTLN